MTNEEKYNEYINEHTQNVLKAFYEYGKKILQIMNNESLENELFELVLKHDKSKLSADEFTGYLHYFYPETQEDKIIYKREYDLAWLNHMNNNKHHPEYWIIRDNDNGIVPIDMDRVYLAEMMLDWIAMGYKFKSTPKMWMKKYDEYYKKNMATNTYNTTKLIIKELWGE